MVETKHSTAREYTDLVRVRGDGQRPHGARGRDAVRPAQPPHLLEAWGQRFDVQLEEHITLFRYQDLPGMLGRVGTLFGEHGVNIVSAAVGRLPDERPDDEGHLAAMAITTAPRCRPTWWRRSSPATASSPGTPSRCSPSLEGIATLCVECRSASTFDFFSSPAGGNSAWAAARSREQQHREAVKFEPREEAT